jgi:D-xylose 1-dehydrogenase (NADP+, D-xylono-1,5-lactone-forming)
MMGERLGFGILGTGNIAQQFARGVAGSSRCVVTAVGSRRGGSAGAFARRFHVDAAHGSYDALLADGSVDAVYVSLPNSMHHQWTVKALAAGKHVLCEKPIAGDAGQAAEMFDAAKKHGRLLVEAFMYRSHPLTKAVLAEVRGGAVGGVRLVRTSFCYSTNKVEGNVRFDPALSGGALMDIGCYCVDFARLVTGAEPGVIQCVGREHATGVDEYACGTLGYAGGVLSAFSCGMTVQTDNAALICGDKGYIRVPVPWKPAERGAVYEVCAMTPPRQDGGSAKRPGRRVVEVDAGGTLYGLEADAFAAAALDGAAPAMTAGESLSNMRVLDELRRQVGLG